MFALIKMALVSGLALCTFSLHASPPQVWVSIPPQKNMVERIAGDRVNVEVLLGVGQNHESFSPSARQMARLTAADLYFSADLPFEWSVLPRVQANAAGLTMVDTVAGVERIAGKVCQHDHGHTHPEGGHHHHHSEDPHLWMEPGILRQQLAVMTEALVELLPEEAARFRANAAAFDAELKDLDASIRQWLRPHAGKPFYINHPALGYFAHAYQLVQVPLEREGHAPTPARLRGLMKEVEASGAALILTQPGYPRSSANVISNGLAIPLYEVDPLKEDFVAELRELAKMMANAFAQE